MANKVFRRIITRVREENRAKARCYGDTLHIGYLPFNLQRLLDYLAHMSKREAIIQSIEANKYSHEATHANIKNFVKLFLIDGTTRDCFAKQSAFLKATDPTNNIKNNINNSSGDHAGTEKLS